MDSQSIVIEKTIDAPVASVWTAITNKDEMKQWYFDLKEFKPEPGFEFSFTGGTETKSYLHHCKIMEVVPGKKISYTWRYEGEPGNTLVTFELIPDGNKTRVKLTHSGFETFTSGNPDLDKKNFVQGWNEILGTSLKKYFEKGN